MSVATKRYVSAYEDGQHTNEMANRSPQKYSSQSQRPSITSATSQPQNTLKRPAPQNEEDRPASKRQKKEDAPETMEADTSYTATNHDRQRARTGEEASQSTANTEKETLAQIEPGKPAPDLDPIFKDVGKSFRIGRTSKAVPVPSINLKFQELTLMFLCSSQTRRRRHEPEFAGEVRLALHAGKMRPS